MKTTISYAGSYNALPTQVIKGAGDGSVSATTTTAYDIFGNVSYVTNPVGATTIYVWDAARQKLGEIGPDPDGGGPLNNRATRTTYTPDGLVASVEKSYAPGGNWGAFVSLQELATTYDALDRKVQDLTVGGSIQTLTQYNYDNDNRLSCTACA